MGVCVIDSSVIVKLFLDEEGRDKAVQLFSDTIQNEQELIAPVTSFYEVMHVGFKNDISSKTILKLLDSQGIVFRFVFPDEKVMLQAEKIAKSGNSKAGFPQFSDAIFHALAIVCKCDFITADKKYYQKVKQFKHIPLL